MDFRNLQQKILVAVDDLDQSKAEVQELKGRLKDAENFIQILKD
jgi:hypothetical protein